MQDSSGRLHMLTEDQMSVAVESGKGGRILSENESVAVVNNNDFSTDYVITSIGERFIWLRSKPGRIFIAKVGDEVTIKDCAFVVNKNESGGRKLMLEGVAPSPYPEDR